MAGKHPKNPLLSNASLNFSFENYSSSALLVPVPQNDSALIPEGKLVIHIGPPRLRPSCVCVLFYG